MSLTDPEPRDQNTLKEWIFALLTFAEPGVWL